MPSEGLLAGEFQARRKEPIGDDRIGLDLGVDGDGTGAFELQRDRDRLANGRSGRYSAEQQLVAARDEGDIGKSRNINVINRDVGTPGRISVGGGRGGHWINDL